MHGPDPIFDFGPTVRDPAAFTGRSTVYHVGMKRRYYAIIRLLALAIVLLAGASQSPLAQAQIIEFDSAGLKFKALTHSGVTVMFAPLPAHIHDYAILQVSVTNGSKIAWAVRPEDFRFERADGQKIQASPAESVVHLITERGSHADVSKLMATYEAGLYGMPGVHSTNGYESRRQSAMGDGGSVKLRAAAAASAIALVTTKLKPGESTDGAVFYPTQGRPLGLGKLVVNTAGEIFEFPVDEGHIR
jgi:hypothetical protein